MNSCAGTRVMTAWTGMAFLHQQGAPISADL